MRHVTRPKNWRVRNKLTAVVLIPGILAGALGLVSLSRTVNDADDYGQFSELARLQGPVLRLVHSLQDERDVTAGFIADRLDASGGTPSRRRAEADAAAAVYRQAAAGIDTSHNPQLHTAFLGVAEELRSLPALRASVDEANLTQSSILAHYTATINRLMELGPALAARNGGSKAAAQVRALNTLSRAVENTSRLRADLNGVLTTGTFLVGQFPDFAGAVARQQETVEEFLATADQAQRTLYADTVKGVAVSATHAIQERVAEQAQAPRLDVEPATWSEVSTRKITLMREVESQILKDLISLSSQAHDSRQSTALWGTVGLLAVFLASGWVITLVVRSMTRPLKALGMSAREVADRRLPEALTRLRQADVDDLADYRATPAAVSSNDEIGEVAEAFDAVQNAAVALVKDQAALRAHINGMFIHLSRRNQHLVSKLLGEIGDLEQHEDDPDRLARLFRLDHLATQMLRTDESLLVLAGSDTGRKWQAPMPLAEILMAASAEVEQFTRIDFRSIGAAAVAADAVTDLVHLLAELMENATVFSAARSRVTVTCRPMSGRHSYLVVSIEDQGSGMTQEQMAHVNHRLASALVLDPGAGRSMGLFVVGRLAAKHGIGVHLIPSPGQGTTALVRIPRTLLAGTGGEHASAELGRASPLTDSAAADGGPGRTRSVPHALSPAQSASPHGSQDAVAHPALRSTEAAEPAFTSRQEWLAIRRFAEGLHTVQTGGGSSPDSPGHPHPLSSDTPGNLPAAEGRT